MRKSRNASLFIFRPKNSHSNKPKLLIIALGKVSTTVLARYKKGKLQLILHYSWNNLIIDFRAQTEPFCKALKLLSASPS